MRSTKEQVERLVCAEHCRFFKPWAETPACCGAYQWLLQRSVAVPQFLTELAKIRSTRAPRPLRADPLLLRAVCTRCDYFPYRCDYRNPTGPVDAIPCGGLVALDLLLDRSRIGPQELYEPAGFREAHAC